MKHIYLKDCHFHDLIIKDISYNEQVLTLHMPNALYEGSYHDLTVEMRLDEYDLSIYRLKQYPRFHRVKLKGKEISLHSLKLFLKKGYTLEIANFLVSTDSNFVILDCVLFPYSSKRGVYNKILFRLDYEYDYLILKEECKS